MYQTYRAYREQISVLCSRWEHCPQKCIELILELSRSIFSSNRTLDIPTRSIGKLAQGRRQDFLSHLGQKYPPQLKINLRGLESIVVYFCLNVLFYRKKSLTYVLDLSRVQRADFSFMFSVGTLSIEVYRIDFRAVTFDFLQ